MSDQSNTETTVKLRPRVAEAVRVWDSLPASDRKYKNVAERMNITEGRAAVYVRDGLVQLGRGDETPRGNGTGQRTSGITVSEPIAQMEQLLEQNRETIDRLQTEIDEADEALGSHDDAKFVAEEEAKLQRALTEAGERLEAWLTDKDGIASKAAEAEGKRLAERAEKIRKDHETQLAIAAKAVEAFESTLAMMREAEGIEPDEEPEPAEDTPAPSEA